jgi:prepilin-type N-terminal cleavage/methylation domain-containing protein
VREDEGSSPQRGFALKEFLAIDDSNMQSGLVVRDKNEMHRQKGFSLIELLIVVAIILIIAAIAIPNLLRARISANESAAVGAASHIEYGANFIQLYL